MATKWQCIIRVSSFTDEMRTPSTSSGEANYVKRPSFFPVERISRGGAPGRSNGRLRFAVGLPVVTSASPMSSRLKPTLLLSRVELSVRLLPMFSSIRSIPLTSRSPCIKSSWSSSSLLLASAGEPAEGSTGSNPEKEGSEIGETSMMRRCPVVMSTSGTLLFETDGGPNEVDFEG